LVAYHVFERRLRGQGIGANALALLQRHVSATVALTRFVVIPADDNYASRRIAEKCDFRSTGHAREGEHWLVFVWDVPTVAT